MGISQSFLQDSVLVLHSTLSKGSQEEPEGATTISRAEGRGQQLLKDALGRGDRLAGTCMRGG